MVSASRSFKRSSCGVVAFLPLVIQIVVPKELDRVVDF